MQHIYDLESIHLDGCGLTIGSFDGVHLGHRALINRMVMDAQAIGLPSVALTFYPHPTAVLRGRHPIFYLSSPEEKADLLGGMGVDYVITQRFDLEFSKVSAKDFLDWLQNRLSFKRLWVGEDFSFGYLRKGNRMLLEQESATRGFLLGILPPVLVEGELISSTRIRQALRAGEVAKAAKFLGRTFVIPGEVVGGANRGKGLGFPTANLGLQEGRAYPGPGVYACIAEVMGHKWPAVTNIGVRPTFEDDQEVPTVETHLLNFNRDLYHQVIRLAFVERLRDERRFASPKALIAQIEKDIQRARNILDPVMETANA